MLKYIRLCSTKEGTYSMKSRMVLILPAILLIFAVNVSAAYAYCDECAPAPGRAFEMKRPAPMPPDGIRMASDKQLKDAFKNFMDARKELQKIAKSGEYDTGVVAEARRKAFEARMKMIGLLSGGPGRPHFGPGPMRGMAPGQMAPPPFPPPPQMMPGQMPGPMRMPMMGGCPCCSGPMGPQGPGFFPGPAPMMGMPPREFPPSPEMTGAKWREFPGGPEFSKARRARRFAKPRAGEEARPVNLKGFPERPAYKKESGDRMKAAFEKLADARRKFFELTVTGGDREAFAEARKNIKAAFEEIAKLGPKPFFGRPPMARPGFAPAGGWKGFQPQRQRSGYSFPPPPPPPSFPMMAPPECPGDKFFGHNPDGPDAVEKFRKFHQRNRDLWQVPETGEPAE